MRRIEEMLGFGITLAAVGGFLDAYSFITAGQVFAGAQSGNTVLLAVHLADGQWYDALRYVLPILTYMGGSAAGAILHLGPVRRVLRSPVKITLVLEILLVAAVLVPVLSGRNVTVTLILSFAAGLQMATFNKVRGWAYATTVTTANYTKWVSAVIGQLPGGDPSARPRSVVFTAIVLAFLAGAVGAVLLVQWLDRFAIVVAALALLGLLTWKVAGERRRNSALPGRPERA